MAEARIEDVGVIVGYVPAAAKVQDLVAIVGYVSETPARVEDVAMILGYVPRAEPTRVEDLAVIAGYVPPPEGLKVTGLFFEYATSGQIGGCTLAGKPETYMIFPDPKLNVVESVTSSAGPYPGNTVSASSNLGRLLPVQSGEYQVGAEDLVLKLQNSGGTGKATYLWRQDSEAATAFRGVDDPRYWHGFHDGDRGALIGNGNSTGVYHTLSNRIILYAGNDISGVGKIASGYRTPDDRYDVWTFATTSSTVKTFATGNHGLAAIELPDGRVMFVQRVDGDAGGPAHDFDVYHSEDGLAITRVSRSIVERFDTSTPAVHNTSSQIRLAVSGEYIRLCFADTSDNLITYVSQDRGMSWKRLTDSNNLANAFTLYDSGNTDDPFAFDLSGVNDSGNFVLFYLSSGLKNNMVRVTGDQDQDWFVPGTLSFQITDTNLYIRTIFTVRGPTYLWAYAYAYDFDSLSGGEHVWMMVRVLREDYLKLDSSWQQQERAEQDGTMVYPGRVKAIWGGSQMVFWGSAKTVAGVDTADGTCWMSSEWTNRSLGARPPSDDFGQYSTKPLMTIWWVAQQLEPSAAALTTWVKAVVGAGAGSGQQDGLVLTGTNAGDEVNYSFTYTSDPGWGFSGKAVVYVWEVSTDTGDSTHTAADVSIEFKSSDGADQWHATVQHGSSTTRLVDNVAASTVGDLTIAMGNGSDQYTRFRLAVDKESGVFTAQLAALDYATGDWVTISGAITTAAVATGTSVKFGHLGQVQATQMQSYWREVAVMIELFNEKAGTRELAFVNPDDLIGQVCTNSSNPPYSLESGVQIAWAGAGGAAGDEFDIDVAHVYGTESMFADSPRLAWKSGGADPQAAQTLIFDAGVTGTTAHTWNHDSMMLIGTTDREIIIDYAASLVSLPVPGATISMDAFGTGDIALTVTAPIGQEITVDTTDVQFTVGELASTSGRTYYVRVTSGPAIGKTWKITEHPLLNKIVCGDEDSLPVQGLGIGDTLVIFADRGAIAYDTGPIVGYRYMRLRMLETDTATGDHQIGAIVTNIKHVMAVPLEWTHTENEQPNITNYRTKGAIQWAYEEGPPQRTITSRIVGDVTQRERDKIRYQLRLGGYELQPICIVMDSARPVETMLYGRIVSGSQFDNAAYYDDSGVLRAAGDMSFQFVEEI